MLRFSIWSLYEDTCNLSLYIISVKNHAHDLNRKTYARESKHMRFDSLFVKLLIIVKEQYRRYVDSRRRSRWFGHLESLSYCDLLSSDRHWRHRVRLSDSDRHKGFVHAFIIRRTPSCDHCSGLILLINTRVIDFYCIWRDAFNAIQWTSSVILDVTLRHKCRMPKDVWAAQTDNLNDLPYIWAI